MKKVKEILVLLTLAMGLFSSCKKYDQCCKATAYDNLNKKQTTTEDCDTKMNKEEYEGYKYNNNAASAWKSYKSCPSRYIDPEYTCDGKVVGDF
jgi:hypothetical protein